MAPSYRGLGDKWRPKSWFRCFVIFIFVWDNVPPSESLDWRKSPQDPLDKFVGSTASLTWVYETEQAETFTTGSIEINDSSIGNINAHYVAKVAAKYESYVKIHATNQSIILSIKDIKKAHGGKYCCMISTRKGLHSNCTNLRVFGGFNWTQSPQNVTQVAVGASISLQWSYDVGEDANVTSIDFRRTRPGERNTSAIGSIDRYGVASELGVYEGHVTLTHMNQSAILRINAVKATDEAQYCCKLKTTKANVEKCARLQVYDPPRASVAPRQVFITEGGNLTLICNATGIPAPSLEWTTFAQPGKVLSAHSELTLHNIQRPGNGSHTLNYTCTATNSFGNPATATVTVVLILSHPSPTTATGSTALPPTPEGGLKDHHIVIIVVTTLAVLMLLTGGILYCIKKKHLMDRHRQRIRPDTTPKSDELAVLQTQESSIEAGNVKQSSDQTFPAETQHGE